MLKGRLSRHVDIPASLVCSDFVMSVVRQILVSHILLIKKNIATLNDNDYWPTDEYILHLGGSFPQHFL